MIHTNHVDETFFEVGTSFFVFWHLGEDGVFGSSRNSQIRIADDCQIKVYPSILQPYTLLYMEEGCPEDGVVVLGWCLKTPGWCQTHL